MYTSISKPVTYKTAVIPGQHGTYDVLRLDDPEWMDGYLDYERLQEQVCKFYGDESTADQASTSKGDLATAEWLYEKVKSLIEDGLPLDEDKGRVIDESADDAIKEF